MAIRLQLLFLLVFELPILSNIVIEYAIMCATSIYSESTFSESGAIIGKHRTSLKPLTVRYQMNLKDKFLKVYHNLKIAIKNKNERNIS